ncbi:hypothetical protein POM88_031285 [Heracleum sosnowskyi]|uniref:Uncharacterized protein n=1 Tax=Heracleum sosnowskyi TaxID=360622 RepID=A0AAD8MJG9_9APIA|nr:hypothetical protein POM88_031285 [Heracleum sosnowskyi]
MIPVDGISSEVSMRAKCMTLIKGIMRLPVWRRVSQRSCYKINWSGYTTKVSENSGKQEEPTMVNTWENMQGVVQENMLDVVAIGMEHCWKHAGLNHIELKSHCWSYLSAI